MGTTPSFVSPTPDYYKSTLPKVWPGDVEIAAEYVRAFFKLKTTAFETYAADHVLDTQAEEVMRRVPRIFSSSLAATRNPANLHLSIGSSAPTSVPEFLI